MQCALGVLDTLALILHTLITAYVMCTFLNMSVSGTMSTVLLVMSMHIT